MKAFTDNQLKQALVKMLPSDYAIEWHEERRCYVKIMSNGDQPDDWFEVLDTELLHLCWLVEETLTPNQVADCTEYWSCYVEPPKGKLIDYMAYHTTWQQRVIALCNVKGIEIV